MIDMFRRVDKNTYFGATQSNAWLVSRHNNSVLIYSDSYSAQGPTIPTVRAEDSLHFRSESITGMAFQNPSGYNNRTIHISIIVTLHGKVQRMTELKTDLLYQLTQLMTARKGQTEETAKTLHAE